MKSRRLRSTEHRTSRLDSDTDPDTGRTTILWRWDECNRGDASLRAIPEKHGCSMLGLTSWIPVNRFCSSLAL